MRNFEIILKAAFLILSVAVFCTGIATSFWLPYFFLSCLVLGVVLLLNKKNSYGKWGNKKKDFAMRRVEGIVLILGATIMYIAAGGMML